MPSCRHTTLPSFPRAHQPKSSLKRQTSEVLWRLHSSHNWSLSLTTGSWFNLQPLLLSFLEVRKVGLKVQSLFFFFFLIENLDLFVKLLQRHNSYHWSTRRTSSRFTCYGNWPKRLQIRRLQIRGLPLQPRNWASLICCLWSQVPSDLSWWKFSVLRVPKLLRIQGDLRLWKRPWGHAGFSYPKV